jgi:hypothetical protein
MSKTVTIILLRADRELWDGGPTHLQVRNMRDGTIILQDKPLAAGSNTIQVNLELLFNAEQIYSLVIEAEGHRPAWQLVKRLLFLHAEGGTTVEGKDLIMRLMLVPDDPFSLDLDQGYSALRAAGSPTVAEKTGLTETAYNALDDAGKMALLNIDAKLRDTRINGVSLLSYVEGLVQVNVDRLLLLVRPELKQLVDVSSDFEDAPGHPNPPQDTPIPLPGHPDSWKHTRFGAGNLQLSFSESTMPHPQDDKNRVFSVDADIDLERGLEHVFEFLDNKIVHPSRKTNQTLVYALLFSQGIIPHYTLSPEIG